LSFRSAIPVQGPGRVVVNDIQLEYILATDPDVRPLIILVCGKGEREEMTRRFYRLKTTEAIENNYQENLRKLEEERKTTVAALTKLAEELDRALAAVEKTAEELTRTNPEETSALYQDAMRLFLEGKVVEALQRLDDEKLRRLTEAAQKRKAKAEQELAQVVDAWLLKGQPKKLYGQSVEAGRTHRLNL
jgi:hypothetical protein